MKLIYNNEEILGSDVYSCEVSEYCDLISNELASNTLNVKIKAPIDKVFRKKEKIVCVNNDGDIMGYFYIEEAKITDYLQYENAYIYDITAQDIIFLLDEYEFLGDYFEDESLNDVLNRIFKDTGINIIIPESLKNINIRGYCPNGTLRDALQFICFTNNLIVNTSRIDGIELKIEDYITKNVIQYENVFSTDIDIQEPVTGVSATAVTYLEPLESDNRTSLYEGIFSDYDIGEVLQTITFEPHKFLEIENGRIVSQTPCYAVIEAYNGYDTVKLTGIPYIKTTISYTKGEKKNSLVLSSNGMINIYNINNLISNIFEYYSNTHTITLDALYAGNIPGDRIAAVTKFGVVYGRISEQVTKITSVTQRVKMTIEGALLPPQEKYYTPNELRTSDDIAII